jgi:transposase
MKTIENNQTIDLQNMSRKDLENEYIKLKTQATDLATKLEWYEQQYRLSKAKIFGTSSEKGVEGQLELPIFNEAETEREMLNIEPKEEELPTEENKQNRKNPHGKKHDIKNMPVITTTYQLSPEEQFCTKCGDPLHEIRMEIRTELEVIPAKVIVHKYESMIYGCRGCEKDQTSSIIKAPGAPEAIIKGSMASASLLSDIMVKKYVDATPLYRQEQDYKRKGIPVTRNNMAHWVIRGSNDWLQLMYDRLQELLLAKDVIHMDETTLEVLSEPHRPATSNSYMWVVSTSACDADNPIALYHYTETRASYHARAFLGKYQGFAHVDGYAGYDSLLKESKDGQPPMNIILVGCMAHVRRKYKEALKAVKPEDYRYTAANQGLIYIKEMFRIEGELSAMSNEDKKTFYKNRYEERLRRLKPIMDDFFAWAKAESPKILPKCSYGLAINYTLNQEEKLRNILLDGRLELTNNRAERTVKPFVLGRKNWLFSNTPAGAKASATVYSIIETAKQNELNPFEYIKYLFELLPKINLYDLEELDQLLPWSNTLPEICKAKIRNQS